MTPGKFISFEGGEGCGKTTHRGRIATRLRDMGIKVITTREMGGTPGAEMVRAVVQSGETDRWDPLSEALLYYGARHDHVEKVIKPALARGEWVLSDRFFDSTTLFQGYAGGLPIATLDAIRAIAIGDFAPDLTIIFDIDVQKGLDRAFADAKSRTESNTRFEEKGLAFHNKVREGLQHIQRDNPERCKLIDADGTKDEVEARVWDVVSKKFGL